MELTAVIEQALANENEYHHRMLIEETINGSIATGCIRKNRQHGSHYDLTVDEYHGLLIVAGSGIYKDGEKEIQISAGDFVQRLPGVTHSTIVTDDYWHELYVVIGRSLYDEMVHLKLLNTDSPIIHPGLNFELINSFLEIHKELGNRSHNELPLVLPKIIDYLTQVHYLDRSNQITTQEQDLMARADAYIKQHIDERLSVQDVAEVIDMGYEKFRKTFTAHYCISPGNYIIQQRIQCAQQMLSEGELTVAEIADHLGYVDSFTFSKQFKKTTGKTPSEFKKLFCV